jgi:hypothetical protein
MDVQFFLVGASLLAMDLKATHFSKRYASSFTSIASKLAPTLIVEVHHWQVQLRVGVAPEDGQ